MRAAQCLIDLTRKSYITDFGMSNGLLVASSPVDNDQTAFLSLSFLAAGKGEGIGY